jgi:hypothetical protein
MYTVSIQRKRNQSTHPHLFYEEKRKCFCCLGEYGHIFTRAFCLPLIYSKLNSCISCRVETTLADGTYTLIPESKDPAGEEEVELQVTDPAAQEFETTILPEGKHRSMT